MTCKQLRFFLVWNGVFGTKRRRTLPLEVRGVFFRACIHGGDAGWTRDFFPAGQKSLRHSSRAGVRNRFLGVYDQISR